MNKSILSIGKKKITADNTLYEVIYEGRGENWKNPFEGYEDSPRPHKWIETFLILDDETRITLPVQDIPSLLPDRSGVVVVFSVDLQGHPINPVPLNFPSIKAPHNAVIFNADGNLRCVINMHTQIGAYIQSVSSHVLTQKTGPYGQPLGEPFAEPIVQFGVLVGDHPTSSPDWFYPFDTATGDLVEPAHWKRY
jgi:hypothetical protein